ncbi:hypothetical protein MMC30_003427 [Trapelia coarctata]|nr:hypothetical protein [Trapelia coarctata]
MVDSTPKSYHSDPTLWLYTSLTAGSSQIITATSRLETILKANKIPFKALDVATDEKARMLWGRRAGKRKLPGLVRMGMVVADIEEVEEWNEYGEIKQNLLQPGDLPSSSTPTPSTTNTPSKPPPPAPAMPRSQPPQPKQPTEATPSLPKPINTPQPVPVSNPSPINLNPETPLTTAMRQASLEAAAKANASKAQKIASYGIKQTPSTLVPGSGPSDKNNAEALKKLENSTPGDSVPPAGSTEAEEAKEPITGATKPVTEEKPRSGRSSVTFKGGDKEKSKELIMPTAPEEPVMKHRGSSVSMATAEEIKAVEESSKITEEPEEEAIAEERDGKKGEVEESKEEGKETTGDASKGEVGGVKTGDATATAEEEEKVPGSKTQDQEAASAEKAGESVAD